jgi:lysine 2,3-aminomutase
MSTSSQDRKEFYSKHFQGSTSNDWSNWIWQVKNSITDVDRLREITGIFIDKMDGLPMRITPHYAMLLSNPAIAKSCVPSVNEKVMSKGEMEDPLGEDKSSPVKNIVHRYPDRVLFMVTGQCFTYCRYCTRSRMVSSSKMEPSTAAYEEAFKYIREHTEIRDVIVSGGDPLFMTDNKIEYILKNLRAIDHVEIIRIGTKAPVVMPQRITHELVQMLGKYHPLYMNIHFIHPDEITPEVSEACAMLANAGIPLGSQTVLLKDINDDTETMKSLMNKLVRNRVKPYYLYQCDPIPGSLHFRTTVDTGIEMIEGLRGHTSGLSVPHYVIDAPGGGGKIPILPKYMMGKLKNRGILLRNYKRKGYIYPEL